MRRLDISFVTRKNIFAGLILMTCYTASIGQTLTHVAGQFSTSTITVNGIEMQQTHELSDTVYVNGDEKKAILLQTSKYGISYRRWFRYDKKEAINTTYISDGGKLIKDLGTDGIIYSTGENSVSIQNLSTNGVSNMTLAADLSNNSAIVSGTNYTEPVIGYRMIYVFRPATDIQKRLDKCTCPSGKTADDAKYLEAYNMMAPAGAALLIGPKYYYTTPTNSNYYSNYYYTNSGNVTATSSKTFYWMKKASGETTYSTITITPQNGKLANITAPAAGKTDTYILTNGTLYLAKFIIEGKAIENITSGSVTTFGAGPSATGIADAATLMKKYKKIAEKNFDDPGLLDKTAKDVGLKTTLLKSDESTYAFHSGATNNNWSEYSFVTKSAVLITDTISKSLTTNNPKSNWCATNIYDRTYSTSTIGKKGYFMYVDAAETQGTVAKLDISDACCQGTKVFISTWIVDVNSQNGSYAPNMNFEIVATDTQGNDSTLTTYTTGDLTGTNSHSSAWKQVFFQFQVPRTTTRTFKTMRLVIKNNQLSSAGDDFGIDDIVAYMEKPAVEAEQVSYLCGKHAKIRTFIDYTQLKKLTGTENLSTNQNIEIGYCFVDSLSYLESIMKGTDKALALQNNRLKLTNHIDNNEYVGHFIFKTNDFSTYPTNWEKISQFAASPYVAQKTKKNTADNDTIYFEQEIEGTTLFPGRRYYIIFNITGNDLSNSAAYSVDQKCDAYTSFVLQGTSLIKVNGTNDLYDDGANFCYNQSPTFSVSQLYFKNAQSNRDSIDVATNGILFDWYTGSLDEFYNQKYTSSAGKFSAQDALLEFRSVSKTGGSLDVVTDDKFTTEMQKVLKALVASDSLVLNVNSYSPFFSEKKAKTYYFQAVPVPGTIPTSASGVCTDAQTILYNVTDEAPLLLYGLPGMNYSKNIVPLRMALKQIKEAQDGASTYIKIPIRTVGTVSTGSTKIAITHSEQGSNVFLTSTDDRSRLIDAQNFKAIGTINIINADRSNSNAKNSIKNYMLMYFTPDFASKVKEGYTYTIKVFYAELKEASTTEYTNRCDGNMYIPIKVVPEYENWTGAAGNNDWNNDKNWSRTNGEEIYADTTSAYTSNYGNTTSNGFVPIDITHVTIKKGTSTTDVPVLTKHNETSATDAALGLDATASDNIAYDMVINGTKQSDNSYLAWYYYENTCHDLYLKPEAELMNAQYLVYNKAHVDCEMTKNRWYLLSSPLKNVVAGDMYMPTSTAKQETEAFADITFNTTDYNRFSPAVYQRCWDKGSAIVYEYTGTATDNTRNVYMKANWSNAYNDVDVDYTPGNGFSIKPVATLTTDKVLMRLPKADASYKYYKADGTESTYSKDITRTDNGKLFTDDLSSTTSKIVTVSNNTSSNQLFLAGNPFPCQMDMAKFFAANTSLSGKYWILSGSKQDAVIFNDGELISTDGTGKTVSPMQGFFVKDASNTTGSESLTFNTDMMTGLSAGTLSPGLKAKVKKCTEFRLSTSNNNILIRQNDNASNGYDDSEDVEIIDDSNLGNAPLVYSVAGNTAVQINQFRNQTTIPLGILHGEKGETPVTINGIATYDGTIILYDASSQKRVTLSNDTTVNFLSGEVGRYFLMFNNETASVHTTSNGNSITMINPCAGSLEIISSTGTPLKNILITNAEGAVFVHSTDIESSTMTYQLPRGIYIVKANSGMDNKTTRIIVK